MSDGLDDAEAGGELADGPESLADAELGFEVALVAATLEGRDELRRGVVGDDDATLVLVEGGVKERKRRGRESGCA